MGGNGSTAVLETDRLETIELPPAMSNKTSTTYIIYGVQRFSNRGVEALGTAEFDMGQSVDHQLASWAADYPRGMAHIKRLLAVRADAAWFLET